MTCYRLLGFLIVGTVVWQAEPTARMTPGRFRPHRRGTKENTDAATGFRRQLQAAQNAIRHALQPADRDRDTTAQQRLFQRPPHILRRRPNDQHLFPGPMP